MLKINGGKYKTDNVCVSKQNNAIIITSQGPGTALEFSLVLVQKLFDYEMANKIAKGMLTQFPKKYIDIIKAL